MIISAQTIGYSIYSENIELNKITLISKIIAVLTIIHIIWILKKSETKLHIIIHLIILMYIFLYNENNFKVPIKYIIGCTFSDQRTNITIILIFVLYSCLFICNFHQKSNISIFISVCIGIALLFITTDYFIAIYTNKQFIINSQKASINEHKITLKINAATYFEYNIENNQSTIIIIYNPYEFDGLINKQNIETTQSQHIKATLNSIPFAKNIEYRIKSRPSEELLKQNILNIMYKLMYEYDAILKVYTKESYNELIKNGYKITDNNMNIFMQYNTETAINNITKIQQSKFNNQEVSKWILDDNQFSEYINTLNDHIKNNTITTDHIKQFFNSLSSAANDYMSYQNINNDTRFTETTIDTYNNTHAIIQQLLSILEIDLINFKVIVI